jgi:hypothetical protein
MRNKTICGIDEIFDFTSVAEIEEYIFSLLDSLEADVDGLNRCHRICRKTLSSHLPDIESRESGGIFSAGGIERKSYNFYPSTYLRITWATVTIKRVRLIVGIRDTNPSAGVPWQRNIDKEFTNTYPDRQYKKEQILVELDQKQSVAKHEDTVRSVIKQLPELPPLPHGQSTDYSRVWCQYGLALIMCWPDFYIGTPSGWLKLKKYSNAYDVAKRTNDPWRALATLGFTFPRHKKKRVWDETMAAQLVMHIFEQNGEQASAIPF